MWKWVKDLERSSLLLFLLSSLIQKFCADGIGTRGHRQGVGAVVRGQLLTNGPGVRWLCKVLGHLPVDVKPVEKE